MKTKLFVYLIITLFYSNLYPCTTAIVSGKFTKNGRPLLFKHRDTETEQNRLMFFDDGKYSFIGLVNSEDINGYEVWGGINSEGFAIINSASYNLMSESADSIKNKGFGEGELMKLALQQCETVDDFNDLLAKLKKPTSIEANFGVIDAKGGAAYFETNNYSFKKIDVNDLSIAPFGYVIRTNYSFVTDSTTNGYGYIRYNTANQLFSNVALQNNLSVKFILQDVSRSLKHSFLNIDLRKNIQYSENDDIIIPFCDYIPRFYSTSTILIEGVKPDESPKFATLWTILGFQLTSVAVPSWVKFGQELPSLLIADSSGNAPICKKALELKKQVFPFTYGSGKRYINISKIINKEKSGFLQKLLLLENKILEETNKKLEIWRKNNSISKKEVEKLYKYINTKVSNIMFEL